MGTPEFAVPCLRGLIDKHEVCGVVTQPDKPVGRGHNLTPPPVKVVALSAGIPVFQPETLKDGAFAGELQLLCPDMIVVVAYGKLLPKYILDFPRYGCVNVHASLLPKYRGAGPIQRCIIDGERETGITTMFMAEGLDTGDMLLSSAVTIGGDETAGELHDRLMLSGAEVLLETIEKIENGTVTRTPQDDSLATYAPMLSKDTGRIDWSQSAAAIVNLVRGTNPWPAAWTMYGEQVFKVFKASAHSGEPDTPGKIVRLDKNGIFVTCKDGNVLIEEIQMTPLKRMRAADFLNGHSLEIGKILL